MGFIYVIILRVERSILLLFLIDRLLNIFDGECQAILNHRRQPMGYCGTGLKGPEQSTP